MCKTVQVSCIHMTCCHNDLPYTHMISSWARCLEPAGGQFLRGLQHVICSIPILLVAKDFPSIPVLHGMSGMNDALLQHSLKGDLLADMLNLVNYVQLPVCMQLHGSHQVIHIGCLHTASEWLFLQGFSLQHGCYHSLRRWTTVQSLDFCGRSWKPCACPGDTVQTRYHDMSQHAEPLGVCWCLQLISGFQECWTVLWGICSRACTHL